jgi:hypothetical protein
LQQRGSPADSHPQTQRYREMSNVPTQTPARPVPASSSSSTHTWHTAEGHDSTATGTPNSESIIDFNFGGGQTVSQGAGAPEKRKCWICLAEEGERTSDGALVNSSRWAKACACSLDAHESCLITWINQTRGPDPNQIVRFLLGNTNIDHLSAM